MPSPDDLIIDHKHRTDWDTARRLADTGFFDSGIEVFIHTGKLTKSPRCIS